MRDRHPPSVLLLAALVLGACSPAGAETAPEPARAVTLELTVAFEDDVDRALLERWAERVRSASARLHRASEGQLCIGRCTLADRAGAGHVVIPSGASESFRLARGEPARALSLAGAWRVEIAGRPDGPGTGLELGARLASELCRAAFGVDGRHGAPGDEPGPACLLADARLCASADPDAAFPRSCRESLANRLYGELRFPNPGFDPRRPAPEVAIEIRDEPAPADG